MAGTPQPTAFPTEIYATLTGAVDQALVQRVFTGLGLAANGGVRKIHVLFQSQGGTVGDGVALYSYLRSLRNSLEIHIYNGGTVSSIGVIAFLGAEHRYASAHATFMIHRSYAPSAQFTSGAAANATRLRTLANSLDIDDSRTLAIFQHELTITAQSLTDHLTNETPFDAVEARACGLIEDIREFQPPAGTKLYNI